MAAFVRTPRGPRLALVIVSVLVIALPCTAADFRPDYRPAAYAIKGARIVARPDSTIESGTVVVREGRIEDVGPADRLAIPYDAETIDGQGLVVYPGFIDLYTTLGLPADLPRSRTGPAQTVPYADFALPRTQADNRNGLTPEFRVDTALSLTDAQVEERRKLGFTDLVIAPAGAIATGQSALVSLSGLPRRESIVRSPLALHINLRPPIEPPPAPSPDESPAVVRRRLASLDPARYPTSLMGAVAHLRQAMLDSEHHRRVRDDFEKSGGARPPFDPALDALHVARTKALPVWWEANTRDEIHRALDLAEEFGTDAVIVGGREAAKVIDRLKARGVSVVLRVNFPDEPKVPSEADYRRREPEDRPDPLRVLADRSARWKEQVETAKALAAAGVRFAFCSDGLVKLETFHAQLRKVIDAGLTREQAVDALGRRAAEIAGLDRQLGTIEPGKLDHLVVMTAPLGDESAKVRYILADSLKFEVEKSKPKNETQKPSTSPPPNTQPPSPNPHLEDQPPTAPFLDVSTEFDEDRKAKIRTGGNVLIQDATILTVTHGTIPRGSILVRDGKIVEVGPDVRAPEGVVVIDAKGLVAMPGIIDTHSHMAIQGGVNEMSLSIVPEVRVRDVVNGDDPTIYRALAGGTTTARLLHGSANVIGGQDVVIKLRHGRPARDLIVDGRPQGVKFALGENVTRRVGRFPNTRMGVEATIVRAFEEGRAYRGSWDAYQAAKERGDGGPPPRRDLRLEALAGIVDGSIKIHCHCYRSDEILMLLRVADQHGIRVQSLQHVLEGYKVAAEIADHGASASTFADWWAYKFEAKDAIPFNAALLTRAGARVCIKSDDEELVRHLYLEAAKMVKYGGVSEVQALEMITLNPAREIGLEDRLGSIDVGKDADVSLFNAHPFDAFARCELTLIDGEVWFQRDEADGRFAPRDGDHVAMPSANREGKDRILDIAANPKGVYALTGATLHPVSGPNIRDGTIIVADGRIGAIGGPGTALPPDVESIDAHGFDIWPGMVDAGTLLGVFEIGSLSETQDYADSATFQPELRTSTALHPDSDLIPVTRANGVLTAYVQPTGGAIAGQGCVIDLDGWVPTEMILVDPVALNVNIPPSGETARPHDDEDEAAGPEPRTPAEIANRRRERIEAIKEQFRRALRYDAVVAEARARKEPGPAPDPRLAALVPYAKGESPVIFRAERRIEILDALKIADELKLKAIITGGIDAWKVTEALRAAKVPVLVGGTLRLPTEPTDPYDAPYANPARLREAGISFAIRSGGRGPDQATAGRNLPYEAATAVAYGLPEADALKAVTLAPAEILGIADQVGSLDVGKRANLVITAGSILQPTTEVKALFIGGKPLPPDSRHTRLFAKYLQRLAEVNAGTAPLGLEHSSHPSPGPTTAPAPSPGAASRD